MNDLNYDREEICFELESIPADELLLEDHQALDYEYGYATTIYFGATSQNWDGPQVLSHLGIGIKARMYEKDRRGGLFLMDKDTECTIEIKSRMQQHGYVSKVKAGTDLTVTYGEFMSYISDLSEIALRKSTKFSVITPVLLESIRVNRITSIIPLGATSYRRKHFTGDGYRLTLDSDVCFYTVTAHDKDIIFSRVTGSDSFFLEIKKPHDMLVESTPIIRLLNNSGLKYAKTEVTKGMRIGRLLDAPYLFLEPELDERADNDWTITEREIKLDAGADPRPTLTAGVSLAGPDIYSGTPIPNINYQKVYDVGQTGIVYMSRDLDGNDPMLKYKTFLKNDELGALVRTEVVLPYTESTLHGLFEKFGKDVAIDTIVVTPYFCRNRIKCNYYMADSRNVFEIYADHSYFVTGGYKDFYQVEIEYAGLICEQGRHKFSQQELEQAIDADFTTLRRIIMEMFEKGGNKLTPSVRTKYDWAATEVFKNTFDDKVG